MKLLQACAIMIIAAATQAETVILLQTGFEPSEGYATGDLNGQNGWFAFIGEDLNFGQVTTLSPLSGTQSVLLDGHQVLLGPFGNYAAVGRLMPIAPDIRGEALRLVETTGLCSILDPTINPNHHSVFWAAHYQGDDFNGACAAASLFGDLVFGWPVTPTPVVVPVRASVPFEFRHVMDYSTGAASLWVNGQLTFENFPGFTPSLLTNEFYFEGISVDQLPFDTKVRYDDIEIRAIYGPCPADLDGDTSVGPADLAILLGAWGLGAGNSADLDGDGTVGASDLAVLLGAWGAC